jgi:hypothetical protein
MTNYREDEMRFTLEIDCDNAAFDEQDFEFEMERILTRVTEQLAANTKVSDYTVGKWELS